MRGPRKNDPTKRCVFSIINVSVHVLTRNPHKRTAGPTDALRYRSHKARAVPLQEHTLNSLKKVSTSSDPYTTIQDNVIENNDKHNKNNQEPDKTSKSHKLRV